ncbi:MAG: hypothetical protein HQ580_07265 [Planctomycetes bacterium]|nr:hypothetical protein [Planctomycetota bacterium]
MSESVNIENKKQNRQKPPRSLIRIVGEILAGTVAGLAVVLLVYVTYFVYLRYILGHIGDYVVFELLALLDIVCPPLYGLASAVGVYLVGTRGKQTGSCLPTLAGGLLGGLLMYFMLPIALVLVSGTEGIEEKIFVWALVVLISLIPPCLATLGFNLIRRYKEPPSA